MTEIIANIKYIRASPRKLRDLARKLKGLTIEALKNQLEFSEKNVAGPLLKAINSAIANAKDKKIEEAGLKVSEAFLRIKTIEITEGPRFKRWQPVSRGQAHEYRKKTSHIKIVLEEKTNGTKS